MAENRRTDYTSRNFRIIEKNIKNRYYLNQDSKVVFEGLKKSLKPILFNTHIKRYIHDHYPELFPEKIDSYKMDDYRQFIINKFEANGVPNSFEETSTKMMASVKNWLERPSVDRDVVFLLGFGLNMKLNDVKRLLLDGLQQQGFNPKSPREAICYWCFKNQYNFSKYKRLWEEYEVVAPNRTGSRPLPFNTETVKFTEQLAAVKSDEELIDYLSTLKIKTAIRRPKYSVTMQTHFKELLNESKNLLAKQSDDIKSDYIEKRNNHSRITSAALTEAIEQKLDEANKKIAYAAIEKELYAAIPKQDGNLMAMGLADLPTQLQEYRLTRDRVNKVDNGITMVNRFDLITLSFLNHALSIEEFTELDYDDKSEEEIEKAYQEHILESYWTYIYETNKMLEDCSLGPLYPGNLYECLTLLCMLTEYPLSTYNDVFEYAYKKQIRLQSILKNNPESKKKESKSTETLSK